MKPTSFEIPQGCTRVTIEKHDNQIITTFEPEVKFNDGDIVYLKDHIYEWIFIYKEKLTEVCNPYRCYVLFGISNGKIEYDTLSRESKDIERIATESEKQQLWDALAKVGKVWNAEKKYIDELKPERWRSEKDCKYWFLNEVLKAVCDTDYRYGIDNQRYEIGNYFQTEQQAKDFSERIKQLPR